MAEPMDGFDEELYEEDSEIAEEEEVAHSAMDVGVPAQVSAGGAGAAEEAEPWLANPSYMTGPNSPTTLMSKSEIWKTVRRLKPGHAMTQK